MQLDLLLDGCFLLFHLLDLVGKLLPLIQKSMQSTIVSALITLDTEKQMDERFWNHLRVQRNILDFLYTLWLDDDRTLVDEFSTIIKDLVEYDFSIAEEQMKERLNIA